MRKKIILSIIFGFLIGFFAGLIGVGGGEFRLPVLIYILKIPFLESASINLIVGFVTVISAILMRSFYQLKFPVFLVSIMSIPSIIGSFYGCIIGEKSNEKKLKLFLALFLFIVGVKIIIDGFIKEEAFEREFFSFFDYFLSSIIGFIVGIISGLFGVAGGEFRIPAFIYIFGLSVKNAGTSSLIVSLPTVLTGILKHNKMKHFTERTKHIGIYMGFSSILGSLLGSHLINFVDDKILKILLGFILIFAVVRMTVKNEFNISCKN